MYFNIGSNGHDGFKRGVEIGLEQTREEREEQNKSRNKSIDNRTNLLKEAKSRREEDLHRLRNKIGAYEYQKAIRIAEDQ